MKHQEGLIKDGEEIMEECEAGAMRDAGIILAGQKVELSLLGHKNKKL